MIVSKFKMVIRTKLQVKGVQMKKKIKLGKFLISPK